MKFLIVGAGATGGYFGACLAAGGADVSFLVRPARKVVLSREGLRVISPHFGDLSITPRLVSPEEIGSSFDCIILAVKAYALEAAIEHIAPAIGANTLILPFLNGLRHYELLAGRFGRQHVVGGVCHIGVTLDPAGRILHLDDDQAVSLGELGGDRTERVKVLAQALEAGRFDVHVSDNILLELWEKWVGLASLAVVTCLMRGTVGEVMQTRWGYTLASQVVAECAAVAAAQGIAVRHVLLERVQASLTQADSNQTCSLYRDLLNGGLVESDHVLVDLLGQAGGAGIQVPLLSACAAQLEIHNRRCDLIC